MGSSLEEAVFSGDRGYIADLNTELWSACAGPLVSVPRVGDWVFFFPQGQLEQVDAYTNQSISQETPNCNLPSQILCKVVHVQLKAECDTGEVHAQVILLPVEEGDESRMEDMVQTFPSYKYGVRSFTKILTASDINKHGGLSVPKKHADECLPPLEMCKQNSMQMLVAKDLHGVDWSFQHIYRVKSSRHLLTRGWSTFVSSKKLVAGDAFIFLRSENGELRVGVRRATNQQHNVSTSVVSSHSMQLGVLASASHALRTGTMFSVFYLPRTSPSNFMIPYHKFKESIKYDYTAGVRFMMSFEGKDGSVQRHTGTIINIEDANPVQWPGSKWKNLRVRWDEDSNMARPEHVSPWQIETLGVTDQLHPVPSRAKKPRLKSFSDNLISPHNKIGLPKSSSEYLSHDKRAWVFQGQEKIASQQISPESSMLMNYHQSLGSDAVLQKAVDSKEFSDIADAKSSNQLDCLVVDKSSHNPKLGSNYDSSLPGTTEDSGGCTLRQDYRSNSSTISGSCTSGRLQELHPRVQ